MEPTDQTFDSAGAAKAMGIAAVTLEKLRQRGEGPAFYRIGRRVVYRWSDIEAWLLRQRIGA